MKDTPQFFYPGDDDSNKESVARRGKKFTPVQDLVTRGPEPTVAWSFAPSESSDEEALVLNSQVREVQARLMGQVNEEEIEGEEPEKKSKKALLWVATGVLAAAVAGVGFVGWNHTVQLPAADVPTVVAPTPEPIPVPTPVPEPVDTPVPEPVDETEPTVIYDEVQRVVGFRPDSAKLTQAGKAELDRIIRAIPDGVSVDVFGYVWEGTPGNRFTLDGTRAQTVAKYLRANNVTVDKAEGLGKKQRGVVVAWMQPVAP